MVDLEALAKDLETAGYAAKVTGYTNHPDWPPYLEISAPQVSVQDDGTVNLLCGDWIDPEDWPAFRIIDRHLVTAGIVTA